MPRRGGVRYPSWIRDRVEELIVMKYEIILEELERHGVYDIPRDSIENSYMRATLALKALHKAEKRWKEVVAKEPPEVRRAIAEMLLSLMSLVYGHE